MPATHFICPDKEMCNIKDCLKNGCRIGYAFEAGRCLSLPTLTAVSQQREWKGVPSTTMLLNGTRETYLKITKDYAIDPQGMMFALFGTGVHYSLEQHAKEEDISEERIFDGISSGSPDRYEMETGFLYDYKTYGSYKTAKILGLVKNKIPIIGADGIQEKYKNGKLKYFDKWEVGHKSRLDVAVQLNDYRMKLESKGHKVNKMFVEALTRDGGTYIAKSRGVENNACLVLINKISDRWVKTYMKKKADDLHKYLDLGQLPPPCKSKETWGGLKCQKYCDVWDSCEVGRKIRNETT